MRDVEDLWRQIDAALPIATLAFALGFLILLGIFLAAAALGF